MTKQVPPLRQPCDTVSFCVQGFLLLTKEVVVTGAAVVGRGVAGVLPQPSTTGNITFNHLQLAVEHESIKHSTIHNM